MRENKINEHLKTLKPLVLDSLKKHPFMFFPFMAAGLWIIVSTFFIATYPEIVPDNLNLNQILFIYLAHTTILAFFCLQPSIVTILSLQNTRIKKLTTIKKLRLAIPEFYIPNVTASLFLATFIYEFSGAYRIIFGLVSCCIVFICYFISWPIRRRVSKKGLTSSKIKLTKSEIFDRLLEGVFIPLFYIALSLFILLEILPKHTRIINIYAPGFNNYLELAISISALLFPSMLIYAFKNLKSVVLGFVASFFMIMMLIPKNLSPTYNWLANHDIANYEGYNFFIKKRKCEILESNNIHIQTLKSGDCKIVTPFKIISPLGQSYTISLKTNKLKEQIEHIKKTDISHIGKISNLLPLPEDLDRKAEIFSKLYKLDILIALKKLRNGELIISEHGLSRNYKFKIIIGQNKALALGGYLYAVDNLVKLSDDASIININYSGTIFQSLLSDTNDQFFRLLTDRLSHSYRHGNLLTTIKDIIDFFGRFVQVSTYFQKFSKLGYWEISEFDKEQVIEVLHKGRQVDLLLLYFKQQDMVIAIAIKNSDFVLNLKDRRIQNLLHAIMKINYHG